MSSSDTGDLLHLTAQIVSAHVGKTQMPADALTALIHSVHAALADAGEPMAPEPTRPDLAVPVKRSVFSDYIVCMEDGKKLVVARTPQLPASGRPSRSTFPPHSRNTY